MDNELDALRRDTDTYRLICAMSRTYELAQRNGQATTVVNKRRSNKSIIRGVDPTSGSDETVTVIMDDVGATVMVDPQPIEYAYTITGRCPNLQNFPPKPRKRNRGGQGYDHLGRRRH